MKTKDEIKVALKNMYDSYKNIVEPMDKDGYLSMSLIAGIYVLNWVLCGEYRLPTEDELNGK